MSTSVTNRPPPRHVAGEWQYAAAWQLVQGMWQQVDAKWLCLGGAAYLKLWQLHAVTDGSGMLR